MRKGNKMLLGILLFSGNKQPRPLVVVKLRDVAGPSLG